MITLEIPYKLTMSCRILIPLLPRKCLTLLMTCRAQVWDQERRHSRLITRFHRKQSQFAKIILRSHFRDNLSKAIRSSNNSFHQVSTVKRAKSTLRLSKKTTQKSISRKLRRHLPTRTSTRTSQM